MLREHATNPDDLRIIASLEKSAERGVDLVRQILTFAQGVGGGHQLVEVKHLLQETTSVISETFPKNIRLETRVPDDLWPIMADPTQIHQVLLNLCVNARDAMPSGGTLSLRAENCMLDERAGKEDRGRRCRAPGSSCTSRTRGRASRPKRLSTSGSPSSRQRTPSKGTGLGLSTVRGIVENHRGFIGLKTQVRAGHDVQGVPAGGRDCPRRAATSIPSGPSAARGNGELILIVDDEAQIRDITAAILSRHGYRVLIAGDGSEAVALFAAQEQRDQRGRDRHEHAQPRRRRPRGHRAAPQSRR